MTTDTIKEAIARTHKRLVDADVDRIYKKVLRCKYDTTEAIQDNSGRVLINYKDLKLCSRCRYSKGCHAMDEPYEWRSTY